MNYYPKLEYSRRLGQRLCGVFLAVSMITVLAHAETQITIFSNGPIKPAVIPNAHITVINVREGDDINEQAPHFNFDPNDPDGQAKAEQHVKEWVQSPAGVAHRARLRQAWRSIETLYNCGIEKVPAVAFEGCKYVVYGTDDVQKALQDYDAFNRQSIQ